MPLTYQSPILYLVFVCIYTRGYTLYIQETQKKRHRPPLRTPSHIDRAGTHTLGPGTPAVRAVSYRQPRDVWWATSVQANRGEQLGGGACRPAQDGLTLGRAYASERAAVHGAASGRGHAHGAQIRVLVVDKAKARGQQAARL